ncbi:hypothetical protein ACWDOP_04605 [Nocardia sp. NPDC003693]
MATGDVPTWTQIQGISSDSEQLRFTPAAARIGLDACTELTYALLAVKKTLDAPAANSAANPEDFAGPRDKFGSGHDWAQAFKTRGTELAGVLNMHVTLVNAMADTFKAAITRFDAAEQESVAALKEVKMPDTARESGPSIRSTDIASRVPKPADIATKSGKFRLENYEPPNNIYAVWPESGYDTSIVWADFHALKQATNSGRVIEVAADWERMRGDLKAAYDAFHSKKNSIWEGWEGKSAKAGRDAVDTFSNDLKTLAERIENVEKGILNAAGWIQATHEKMPDTAAPAVTKTGEWYYGDYPGIGTIQKSEKADVEEALLQTVRGYFEYYYANGVKQYNDTIDSMALPLPAGQVGTPVAPVAPVVPVAPVANNPGGNGGSPSSPSSPSNPGSTAPTADTEAAAAAAAEAARLAAEQAAKQAEETTKQAEETTKQQALEALSTAASEALTSLQTVASEGLTALQSAVEQNVESLSTGLESLTESLTQALTTDLETAKDIDQPGHTVVPVGGPTTTDPGKTTGGGGGGGGGGGAPVTTTTAPKDTTTSKLYPRSTVSSEATTTSAASTSRAGLASTTTSSGGMPMGGMPMGAGAGGAGGQGKEHKRAEFLRGSEHLDEVFEEVPVAVRPVAEK